MEKVFRLIGEYRMLEDTDLLVAGVSGGADSVCLLALLREYLAAHPGPELLAVHVEHGIRGEESLADAAFVEELCREWNVPLQIVHRDVPALAAARHLTLEEAGRQARYEAFRAAAGGAGRIAVAHHAGDQAETVLMNLARGSSLAGLSGMRPLRGQLLRPLLYVTRQEIEAYLTARRIPWRTDATNASLLYARNRVRHQVIPALAGINEGAVRHIGEAAGRLARIQDYLEAEGRAWLAQYAGAGGGRVAFPAAAFRAAAPVLQDFILQAALAGAGAPKKDLTSAHIESLRALAGRQSGRRLENLPGDLRAYIEGDRMVIEYAAAEKEPAEDSEQPVTLPIPGTVSFLGFRVTASLEPAKNERIPEKKYTKWFDYDTITDTIQLRTRRSGDYLTIAPGCRKKKLKQYFIDEKIPAGERSRRLLFACGPHILWVAEGRISEAFKVTDRTENLLKIQIWKEGKNDGRQDSSITE